jgi:hypothetical protein
VDVVLAVDDDLLLVLEKLGDDDRLIRHVARYAIRVEEVDRLEEIGFQIGAQLFERGSGRRRAAVAIVNVLFDKNVAGSSYLLPELGDLALDGSLLFLRIGAHASVKNRFLHIRTLIPQVGQKSESNGRNATIPQRSQVSTRNFAFGALIKVR